MIPALAKSSIRRLALAVMLSIVAAPAPALDLRDVPLPHDTRLQIVGDDMLHNGQAVSIASFSTALSVDDTMAWYRVLWPGHGEIPGHVEAEVGGWRVISHLQDRYNIVLQLQSTYDGTARGWLSVLDLDATVAAPEAPLLPDGATLLSDSSSNDGARRARTILFEAYDRPGSIAAFYRDRMRRNGWQVVVDEGDASPAVLLFTGPDGRAELTVNADLHGHAFGVLNLVSDTR